MFWFGLTTAVVVMAGCVGAFWYAKRKKSCCCDCKQEEK